MSYETQYSTLYRLEDEYTLKQASIEGEDEYIIMERSAEDVLECERDTVQVMFSEVQGYLEEDQDE
jgi:hypothetical protein